MRPMGAGWERGRRSIFCAGNDDGRCGSIGVGPRANGWSVTGFFRAGKDTRGSHQDSDSVHEGPTIL